MTYYKNSTVLIVSLLFCGTVLLLYARPDYYLTKRIEPRRVPVQDCSTVLASDLYGLGVRLGTYFQWLSSWVANTYLPDEIAGGLDANAMYLSAILISIVHSTAGDKMTLMDGLVLMWLCAGTTASVMSLWGYRTCVYKQEKLRGIRRFGGFGTHFRLLLTTCVAVYGIWYWTIAVRTDDTFMLPFGTPGTGEDDINENCLKDKVTVFNQDVQGNARYFALTLSIAAGVYSMLLLLASPLAAITRIRKMLHFWNNAQYASSTRLRFATAAKVSELVDTLFLILPIDTNKCRLEWAYSVLSVLSLIWIVFTMFAIEYTLNENCAYAILGAQTDNDDGKILTPGQLLPMVIGSFSFIRVLFIRFKTWRNPGSDSNSPSLGRDLSRRHVKAKNKRDSTHGMGWFKLFSAANASQEVPRSETNLSEDRYVSTEHFQRMNIFVRAIITIVPHLSLLWSWPWNNDYNQVVTGQDDGSEITLRAKTQTMDEFPLSLRKSRTVTWDKETDTYHDDRDIYDSPIEESTKL